MLLLVDDVLGTLDLDDQDLYWTESLSMPLPAVRDVAQVRTEADGTYDQTRHLGARAVVATVACLAGADGLQPVVDRIRAYLHPSRRPTLVWECLGGGRRQMVVRPATHDVVYQNPEHVLTTIGLVAPSGLQESEELHSVTMAAVTTIDVGGRTYDLTFDRIYPTTGGAPFGSSVLNAGSAAVWNWKARLYGPCTEPQLENLTVGATIAFKALSLAAGQYVEVDAGHHTALLNSDPNLSVYNKLDVTVSRWWPLVPGNNLLRFRPFTATTGSVATIEYRDAWL